MTNVEIHYLCHLLLLRSSEEARHREQAEAIALDALKKRRARYAKHPRKTEPYKARFEATLGEYDALIERLT